MACVRKPGPAGARGRRGCGKGEVGEKDAPEPQVREAGKGKEENGTGRLELGDGELAKGQLAWGGGRARKDEQEGSTQDDTYSQVRVPIRTHVRWIRMYVWFVHRREFCFRRGLGCCSLPVSRPV